jgi:hypothetical protein
VAFACTERRAGYTADGAVAAHWWSGRCAVGVASGRVSGGSSRYGRRARLGLCCREKLRGWCLLNVSNTTTSICGDQR